jgi:nucleotide-binding universal stress UspA family protein
MKILHFVADQPFTESVLTFTCHVAELTKSTVTLLYVAAGDNINEGWMALEKAQNTIPDMDFQIKLEQGEPVEVLLAELEREAYDMVVLGLRRRRRIVPSAKRLLFQKILRYSPVPVMLVRAVNFKLENMLICSGGVDISEPVVETSADLARSAGIKATLLHVSPNVPSMYTGMGGMQETLEEILAGDTPLAKHLKASAAILADHQVESQIELRHGAVADEILKEAEEGPYDLIALGASVHHGLSGILLNEVTQQIINRSKSAVLVVRKN